MLRLHGKFPRSVGCNTWNICAIFFWWMSSLVGFLMLLVVLAYTQLVDVYTENKLNLMRALEIIYHSKYMNIYVCVWDINSWVKVQLLNLQLKSFSRNFNSSFPKIFLIHVTAQFMWSDCNVCHSTAALTDENILWWIFVKQMMNFKYVTIKLKLRDGNLPYAMRKFPKREIQSQKFMGKGAGIFLRNFPSFV